MCWAEKKRSRNERRISPVCETGFTNIIRIGRKIEGSRTRRQNPEKKELESDEVLSFGSLAFSSKNLTSLTSLLLVLRVYFLLFFIIIFFVRVCCLGLLRVFFSPSERRLQVLTPHDDDLIP